jgi:outer membrane protein
MKNVLYVAVIAMSLFSCQNQKIGFVDNGTIINEYQEKKDVEAKFQEREESFRKRADSISQGFQAEAQITQTEAQKLAKNNNREKAEELMGELQQKQQMLQKQMQYEQQQLTQEFQNEIDSLIVKVKGYVKDYGKTNGYTYILGTSDAAASVMYGANENDLTKTVLEALNTEYENAD